MLLRTGGGEIVLGRFAGLLVLKTLLREWMLPLELHARRYIVLLSTTDEKAQDCVFCS